MKILVEGKLDKLRELKFECPRCGCVFVANAMEYCVLNEDFYGYYVVQCECPCCKMKILIDEPRGY